MIIYKLEVTRDENGVKVALLVREEEGVKKILAKATGEVAEKLDEVIKIAIKTMLLLGQIAITKANYELSKQD